MAMNLSELVNFYCCLKKSFPGSVNSVLRTMYDPFLITFTDRSTEFGNLAKQCIVAVSHLEQTAVDTNEVLSLTLHEIHEKIRQHDSEYYQHSSDLFHQSFIHNNPEYVLSRTLQLGLDAETFVKSRLQLYSDWKYPGLAISPIHYDHIESMVALDPLYIADVHRDLWTPVKQRFHESYVRRLRFYEIIDTAPEKFFQDLPTNQFGVVLCYYFLNFRPMEILSIYLQNIFACLRPGGIFAFTFNDCDTAAGVALVERNFMCYTPGFRVRQIISDLGYEIISEQMLDSACRWMEIQKPGNLQTLRGGQCLAKIIAD